MAAVCAFENVEATSRIDVNLPLVMAMQFVMAVQPRVVVVIGDRTGDRVLRRRAHAA
jgi:hypothetical protein